MGRTVRDRVCSRSRRLLLLSTLAVLICASGPAASPDPDASADRLRLSSDLRIVVHRGRDVVLEVLAKAGDGYHSIARRVVGDERPAAALAAWHGERPLEADEWVAVPMGLLSPEFRSLVLRNLFPEDRREGGDWIHIARAGSLPTYDEGLWQVAEWFTGRGSHFTELMRVNGLTFPELRAGQEVRVPEALLDPAFRAGMRSDDGALEFESDEQGPYAVYHLRSGEALYSAVVVRFTGRTGSDDVAELAEKIRERSRIPDLRDIPVGYAIRIPLEILEPEFLPTSHPRRLEAEARRAELDRELRQKPVGGTRGGLEGVLVLLDPGHGGRDLGTMNNGIWEHDYVYDVACRLKRGLERHTSAEVRMTLEDKETGCVPSSTDKLVANRQGTVLTSPPFLAREEGEAKIGVNLRWYLANSIYRQALRDGYDPDRVVFLSLHADARHASLRGLMVYVPGASYRTKTYGHNSKLYRKYREVREKPHVHFSHKERVRSEAVSRKLAGAIVESYRRERLAVQPYQPVRNKVIRGRHKWVPAVLRGNAVPNKVLVEMVNLSNAEDAATLASARQRDRLAEGLLQSLYRYFGELPADMASAATAD